MALSVPLSRGTSSVPRDYIGSLGVMSDGFYIIWGLILVVFFCIAVFSAASMGSTTRLCSVLGIFGFHSGLAAINGLFVWLTEK